MHAAPHHAENGSSIFPVYARMRGLRLTALQGFVRHVGREAKTVIETTDGERSGPLPGYRLKYFNGDRLAASVRLLKGCRSAAPAPCRGNPSWFSTTSRSANCPANMSQASAVHALPLRMDMGLVRTGQPAAFRRPTVRPRQPAGSAEASQDHTRPQNIRSQGTRHKGHRHVSTV